MSRDTFDGILDELGDTLFLAYLYGWGEPFVNKNMKYMIKSCTDRGIHTLTSTNGHFLQTVEEAMEIVDAGLTVLIIAFDGSTQKIYESYRIGGSVEKVKRCAHNIEEAKKRLKSKTPYTNIRVVVTKKNQEDLENNERIAREVG